MKKKLALLLVDFDGVMSNGRFYNSTDVSEQEMGKKAVENIFTTENTQILNEWMRGKRSYKEMHDFVESRTDINARELDNLLEESVKRMPINQPLLRCIENLRKNGVTVSLFTNNMDIFDTVSRFHHELDNHFDHIYSSSAYGQLKLEDDVLLTRAMQEAGTDAEHTAFVDDAQSSHDAATGFGVATFIYKDYEDSQKGFEQWLEENYTW